MRIISNFHDYYDSAMGFGQDPGLIYERRVSEKIVRSDVLGSKFKEIMQSAVSYDNWIRSLDKATAGIIGFCGKAYPLLLAEPEQFTVESCTAHKNVALASKEAYILQTEDFWSRKYGRDRGRAYDDFIEGFNGAAIGDFAHQILKAPVFLARFNVLYGDVGFVQLYSNPRLANFGFAKNIEPFTAFQEIAMYLGSQLAVEDRAPRTVGDDKIIAQSKGFDEQSFRTAAPGTKKINRKANRERKKGL
jgi:hypothetical protein